MTLSTEKQRRYMIKVIWTLLIFQGDYSKPSCLGEQVYFQGKQLDYFHTSLPSQFGSALKGKNLLPGSKFFPLRADCIS